MSKYEGWGIRYKQLAEQLAKLPKVTRHDEGERKEAWVLSHSFLDLEESFKKFIDEQLPRLSNENLSNEEIDDVLQDIGDNFMHILYHIHDPKIYSYLLENPNQK